MANRIEYGLLFYKKTLNLGDEIQSIAASQFLPTVDHYINRETLRQYDGPPVKAILNGWYMHHPRNWPPSEAISPLLTSIHISQEISPQNTQRLSPVSKMTSGAGLEYFKKHGPIGTRDRNTQRILEAAGIDSYFSGCMTLSFPSFLGSRTDDVCCVDIDDHLFLRLQEAGRFKLRRYSHFEFGEQRKHRFALAQNLLDTYKRSRLVITSRLHCALPSLAFGTPVIFVETAPDAYRFDGLRDLLHTVPRSAMDGPIDNWWSAEMENNKPDFVALRRNLLKQASKFISDMG